MKVAQNQHLLRRQCGPSLARQYATQPETTKKPRKTAAVVKPPSAPKALKAPKGTAKLSAYTLFIQNFAAERKKSGESFLLRDAGKAYKALPDSEKSKLLEQIPELISQRKAIYDEFIKKLSPAEILAENKTRAALRKTRIAAGKTIKNLSPIVDPNAPKKPLGSFFLYYAGVRGDSEFAGMSMVEQSKAIGEKWKSLGEAEKSKYVEQAQQEKEQYKKKYDEYYGN